jgi:hypothetical protein
VSSSAPWTTADPDIPILKEAEAEHAKLRGGRKPNPFTSLAFTDYWRRKFHECLPTILGRMTGNPEVIRRGRTPVLSTLDGITGEIQNLPHEIEVAKSVAVDSLRQPYIPLTFTRQPNF